ncbi:MAG: histidine kinase, partial [Pseudanabaenales cyanobacterium]|nr:histidine kinase [Pseudanabaenales cyanobacterium]
MIQSSPQVVHNRMQSDRHRGVAPLQGRARKNEMLREQRSRLAQWFYNLPVRQKILLGLTIPGIFSILVLIAVQYQFFVSEVRTHLVKQAKLELAVIEDEYNNKFEQMRISAHGRVENPLIIAAVQDDTVDAVATPEIRKDIKGILRGEVAELDIEYATLVGRNLRIIANANADRTGDVFNPDGLVSEALTAGRQIKTSSVVSWDELAKESSPLPDQFNRQDALIRYTATPVKAPNTKEVLGVLVLGDIVRHKFPTVKNTVNKWGDGYSGVYRLASDGELSLVASLAKDAK